VVHHGKYGVMPERRRMRPGKAVRDSEGRRQQWNEGAEGVSGETKRDDQSGCALSWCVPARCSSAVPRARAHGLRIVVSVEKIEEVTFDGIGGNRINSRRFCPDGRQVPFHTCMRGGRHAGQQGRAFPFPFVQHCSSMACIALPRSGDGRCPFWLEYLGLTRFGKPC
jgi:hypothetical protein